MIIDKIVLLPYFLSLSLRNSLYDKGKKKSYSYDVPIISVGNITVGGTGKTPHVEMLVRLLKEKYRVAVISRGYKRRTRGMREVAVTDSYKDVGDEPIQIKRKFPDITVVVDASRKRSIEWLLALPEEQKPTIILLDDAFQHRKIKPSLSILLVDYSRPIFEDGLLPFGNLRDLPSQIKRADIVIVTKVPDSIEPLNRNEWRKRLRLRDTQPLFFSKMVYDTPKPLYEKEGDKRYLYSKTAILFSGIANDAPLRNYLIGQYKLPVIFCYSDHHDYTSSEIRSLDSYARKNSTSVIITTEKDAQRILGHKAMTPNLKSRLFFIPMEPQIIPEIPHGQRVIEEELGDIGREQFVKILP